MKRYESQLNDVVTRLRAEERGFALVVVPASEQGAIAKMLSHDLVRRVGVLHHPFDPEVLLADVSLLPDDRNEAVNALRKINGRREWVSDRGLAILVVDRDEYNLFSRNAPDVMSSVQVVLHVAFEPADVDEETARAELHNHLGARFGRLDLRGFIRSEVEDASFAVEDIYQPLEATAADGLRSEPLVDLLTEARGPHLILGPPGCGKSFFLRWLAIRGSALRSLLGIKKPIPVHVSLAAYALTPGRPPLIDYIVESLLRAQLSIVSQLKKAARQGRVLFLLDGLDEAGDSASRSHIVEAVAELDATFPNSHIVMTSRQSGLDEVSIRARELTIAPLSGSAIRNLLVNWCRLYERHRTGTGNADEIGAAEGAKLANEVVNSESLRELASTPLLATIIAIVHRAGVRLPDHRAELYEHIVRILVERWNQIRSSVARSGPPLRMSDAVRLLGPVALQMIEMDNEGGVDQESLREMLERTLDTGAVRAIASADDALRMFKESLGLLVERAPRVFGFLHQTFVEYLAAHELIRTAALEKLCARSKDAFLPKWREVLLLSAGIVGQVQASDERLSRVVRALIDSARHRPGRPSAAVPSLLAGILADDPALTPVLSRQLVNALVPKWWFGRQYGESSAFRVATESLTVGLRIWRGAWGATLRAALPAARDSIHYPSLFAQPRMPGLTSILMFLDAARIEIAPALIDCAFAAADEDEHINMCFLPRFSKQLGEVDKAWFFDLNVSDGVREMLFDKSLRSFWMVSVQDHRGPLITTNQFQVEEADGEFRFKVGGIEKGTPRGLRLVFLPARVSPEMLAKLRGMRSQYSGTELPLT